MIAIVCLIFMFILIKLVSYIIFRLATATPFGDLVDQERERIASPSDSEYER